MTTYINVNLVIILTPLIILVKSLMRGGGMTKMLIILINFRGLYIMIRPKIKLTF